MSIKEQTPAEIRERMQQKETFVLNIAAAWCPDCTIRQEPNLPAFVQKIEDSEIPVYQCLVQEERLVFLSEEHESLVNDFGGHGYPRTSLIVDGALVDSKVEVMDALALSMLAGEFLRQI
ncbi:MAG: hypothetical protein KAR01_00055 [Desulfocapsa sp.]|nr:hypothetical protein [Desulfocapsa sp.]